MYTTQTAPPLSNRHKSRNQHRLQVMDYSTNKHGINRKIKRCRFYKTCTFYQLVLFSLNQVPNFLLELHQANRECIPSVDDRIPHL